MKQVKLMIAGVALLSVGAAFAGTTPKKYNIYVTNNTPYTVQFHVSLRNQTPVTFTRRVSRI